MSRSDLPLARYSILLIQNGICSTD